ncbi:MAG: hypothetical protein JWM99_400 [Verrucomicrobiales bacterium]|nr:hypothetical protein [Verrucomicrobiales bacterium]
MDPLNKAFIQLVSKSGWTKAETARRLELTPAVITRYFNGETRPSLTTIKLLKLTLGDTSPLPGRDTEISVGLNTYRELSSWEENLLVELRRLERGDARKLAQSFRGIIEMLK